MSRAYAVTLGSAGPDAGQADARMVADSVGMSDAASANTPSGGQQSAVSLVAADGETLSGGVQSNFAGDGFHTRNGFTRARDWAGPNPLGGNFAGFDDPSFLPIATWLTDPGGQAAAYDRMDDLGLNGMLPASGAINLDTNITRGKWAVVPSQDHPAGTITAFQDPGVVGVSTGEEPSSQLEYETNRWNADAWLASVDGPGRFHLYNFTHNLMNGDIAQTYSVKDMVIGWISSDGADRSRRQYLTCDNYWFAGTFSGGGSPSTLDFRLYQNTGVGTLDQSARGSHYGSMMDSIRKAFAQSPNVLPGGPIGVWVEAAAPLGEAESQAMTPARMGWAIWSTLVHGARGIYYFVHNFRTGDTWGGAFWDDHFGAPGIPGTGIYAAAKEINLRALQIAPVINSPFDGYFVYGDVTFPNPVTSGNIDNPGFLTAVTSTNTRGPYSGVDACCKWQPGEGKHYILATTRESESASNVPVSCRMVDQGQTVAVPVFGGPSISIQRGGAIPTGLCEFSDVFTLASDYKCWRID